MAEKMYFGVLESIKEIPAPKSGMGFDSNSDTEVTELVSGGRSVFRAPTTYKTFNMTWASNSAGLRHLIDMYNGQYGTGPFYITDPTMSPTNVLPPRWGNSWQLAHQSGGWARPRVSAMTVPSGTPNPATKFTNRVAEFTQATTGTPLLEGVVRTRLIRVPGKAYYLTADISSTGGAGVKVRGYNGSTGVWTTLATVGNSVSSSTMIAAENLTTTMIELDLYLPLGSTLVIRGLALSNVLLHEIPNDWMPAGQGVGAVQFGDTTGGELVSNVIDRIGLSLDFLEVESIEG